MSQTTSRTTGRRLQDGECGDDPSPEEIRNCCRKIRQAWSEATRRQRSGESHARWSVPEIRDPKFQVVTDAYHG
jgi:hypothetical protein